jgi:D-amino-acid dehydrogenase
MESRAWVSTPERPFWNLFINAGHGNLGWTMAFGSADILASTVRGDKPDALAIAVAPRRRRTE